jgi:hypothetical protein
MASFKVTADKGAEKIFGIIDERLMYQYRNNLWPSTLKVQISNEVENILDSKELQIRLDLEKKFEKFIPIPTANFKTRWKFFWTGKLA